MCIIFSFVWGVSLSYGRECLQYYSVSDEFSLILSLIGRKTITGSFIGSMEETRAVGVLGREGSDVNDRGGEDGLREHCNGENGKERRQV